MQSIVTSPQLQPVAIQHQRVLTPAGQTIQTLSTAPTTVHTMQQQVQQVPVSNSAAGLHGFYCQKMAIDMMISWYLIT